MQLLQTLYLAVFGSIRGSIHLVHYGLEKKNSCQINKFSSHRKYKVLKVKPLS